MADDVSKPLQVTGVWFPPGLSHDAWPIITTADKQDWPLDPKTVATCDGVPVDALGLIGWLGIYPCEAVLYTEPREYHAVTKAVFTSTHNRGTGS